MTALAHRVGHAMEANRRRADPDVARSISPADLYRPSGGFANDVVVALALAAEWNAYQSPLVIATKPRPQCMGQAYQCDALVWNGRCLEYVEDHECV